jgi:hypothetical protein
MKVKTIVRLVAFAAILASVQSFALAQNGQRFGYTATDLDMPGGGGNRIYRIPLDNPTQSVQLGLTGVNQELEGFFSIDGPVNSRVFGVAENPDVSSTQDPSVLVDITAAACGVNGSGALIGETGIDFGTEAGSAWDSTVGMPNSNTVFSIASDDLALAAGTALYEINPSTGLAILRSITEGIYLDGLAVGSDGTLYATGGRTNAVDGLYRYNFDDEQFVLVGSFGQQVNEDTGLANFRGASGTLTELYMITEGDGANVGRLWRINHTNGALTLVGELRLAVDNSEVPEDVEGFDIPWRPLACN